MFKKPPLDLEPLKKNFDSEMYEALKPAEAKDWEKEGNSKEWNTKAKELNAKKDTEMLYKSINRKSN